MSISNFKKDVDKALSSNPKSISSKYFYDEKGSKLFQDIMSMEEYYLTDAEFEIFDEQGGDIAEQAFGNEQEFDLVELGAGDGLKTKLLIKHLLKCGKKFDYIPIDISESAIVGLIEDLNAEFPNLNVHAEVGEYVEALKVINAQSNNRPKLVLFLGSNLGNFKKDDARVFLSKLKESMRVGDKMLIGIDLQKDPHTIRNAYDDPHGITKQFNLNLLERMNRELGANFNIDLFDHYQSYDPTNGEVRSYIYSKTAQTIHVDALNKDFHFSAWEMMHTEISRKYALLEIEEIGAEVGFKTSVQFVDSKGYFSDTLWELTS